MKQTLPSRHNFTNEEHRTWTHLYCRQLELVQEIASSLYTQGFASIGFDPFHIPDQAQISQRLEQLCGWSLASAQSDYLNADQWFGHLVQRHFPVTSYIRGKDSLDYTPYPDLFHDYFGHLPLMNNPYYADIVYRYGAVYQQARTDEQRLAISRLWWFSMEFGFMWEDGRERIIGASLYTSFGEHNHAISPNAQHYPFDIKRVAATESSTHQYHQHYFVVDSLEDLRAVIDDYARQEGLEI